MDKLKKYIEKVEVVNTRHNHSCKKKDCAYCNRLKEGKTNVQTLLKVLNLPNTYVE